MVKEVTEQGVKAGKEIPGQGRDIRVAGEAKKSAMQVAVTVEVFNVRGKCEILNH